METFAALIWILLTLTIPLILIVISIIKYSRQENISRIIFKFFIAVSAFAPVAFFALIFFGGMLNAVVHKKILTFGEIILCFVVDFVYAVIGFLLCAFVNGGFMKPWLIFSGEQNKPQSIFKK